MIKAIKWYFKMWKDIIMNTFFIYLLLILLMIILLVAPGLLTAIFQSWWYFLLYIPLIPFYVAIGNKLQYMEE